MPIQSMPTVTLTGTLTRSLDVTSTPVYRYALLSVANAPVPVLVPSDYVPEALNAPVTLRGKLLHAGAFVTLDCRNM